MCEQQSPVLFVNASHTRAATPCSDFSSMALASRSLPGKPFLGLLARPGVVWVARPVCSASAIRCPLRMFEGSQKPHASPAGVSSKPSSKAKRDHAVPKAFLGDVMPTFTSMCNPDIVGAFLIALTATYGTAMAYATRRIQPASPAPTSGPLLLPAAGGSSASCSSSTSSSSPSAQDPRQALATVMALHMVLAVSSTWAFYQENNPGSSPCTDCPDEQKDNPGMANVMAPKPGVGTPAYHRGRRISTGEVWTAAKLLDSLWMATTNGFNSPHPGPSGYDYSRGLNGPDCQHIASSLVPGGVIKMALATDYSGCAAMPLFGLARHNFHGPFWTLHPCFGSLALWEQPVTTLTTYIGCGLAALYVLAEGFLSTAPPPPLVTLALRARFLGLGQHTPSSSAGVAAAASYFLAAGCGGDKEGLLAALGVTGVMVSITGSIKALTAVTPCGDYIFTATGITLATSTAACCSSGEPVIPETVFNSDEDLEEGVAPAACVTVLRGLPLDGLLMRRYVMPGVWINAEGGYEHTHTGLASSTEAPPASKPVALPLAPYGAPRALLAAPAALRALPAAGQTSASCYAAPTFNYNSPSNMMKVFANSNAACAAHAISSSRKRTFTKEPLALPAAPAFAPHALLAAAPVLRALPAAGQSQASLTKPAPSKPDISGLSASKPNHLNKTRFPSQTTPKPTRSGAANSVVPLRPLHRPVRHLSLKKLQQKVEVAALTAVEAAVAPAVVLPAIDYTARSDLGARRYQEDAVRAGYLLDSSVAFAGVFDGHGGADASRETALALPARLAEALVKSGTAGLARACTNWDDDMRSVPMKPCGTTAAVAMVQGAQLTALNVGDSSVILVKRDGSRVMLSEPHNTTNDAELQRLRDLGRRMALDKRGQVWRLPNQLGQQGLMITRSFGDFGHKTVPGVTCEPHLVTRDLVPEEDVAVVVVSDGVTDVLTPDMIAASITDSFAFRVPDAVVAAESVMTWVREALSRGQDNYSVAVLLLKWG